MKRSRKRPRKGPEVEADQVHEVDQVHEEGQVLEAGQVHEAGQDLEDEAAVNSWKTN